MSEPEISRLREDLDVMRQAAGVDLPFNWTDVWVMNPVICVAGAVIACLGWWTPSPYRWVAVFPAGVSLIVWLYLARAARRHRAVEPVRWREQRYGLWLFLVVVPTFVGFILWEAWIGIPRAAIGAGAVFFLGLGLGWFALIDRTRRYYIGCALPLMVFGLTVPLCDPRQARVGVGLLLIAVGLATAAVQVWQLRGQQRNERRC